MIRLHWHNNEFTADIAVKGANYVALYDNSYNETQRITNIHGKEWEHISIEGGDWTDPSEIPSKEEILRADVDYLTMENEYLEEQAEQYRADIDYCLMLLEE